VTGTTEFESDVTSAVRRTEGAMTARFEASDREHTPNGPGADRYAEHWVGIVDFATRRAICAPQRVAAGPLDGMLGRSKQLAPEDNPFVFFFEGPSMCGALPWRGWTDLHPNWPVSLPRKPRGLTLLDLLNPSWIIEQQSGGEEGVRGVPTRHLSLRLRLDKATWPKPPRPASAAGGRSLLDRLGAAVVRDPRPHGETLAEVWIDNDGKLRRFSWACTGPKARVPDRWTTTELWDFGVPPPIADLKSQPVIDPITLSALPIDET
jgi:hypothetical protein